MNETIRRRYARLITTACLIAAMAGPGVGQDVVPPRPGARPAAERLEALIRHEIEAKGLPAVSIALVEGKRIVWAKGFGLARPKEGIAATAETVYRVGSVSKLFTDLAVMQLVERGELDLDAPVSNATCPTSPPGTRSAVPRSRSGS